MHNAYTKSKKNYSSRTRGRVTVQVLANLAWLDFFSSLQPPFMHAGLTASFEAPPKSLPPGSLAGTREGARTNASEPAKRLGFESMISRIREGAAKVQLGFNLPPFCLLLLHKLDALLHTPIYLSFHFPNSPGPQKHPTT